MKAKYQVLSKVENLLANKTKVTTQDVAKAMQLSRGVVSTYLSQLYQEGLLLKSGTKPVYWQLNSNDDVFAKMIGSDGSLKKVIDKCKAAVNYPPNGFPLIITGPSGSGKSFLASLIYEYAKQVSVISQNANFVVLNCADYANNPELLSSVLFGYKKGAFTGADQDHLGLVDQADGGYLFLDEIHRLPRESQEKLFVLLDSGKFYPLGESKHFKQVNVRFIFATTEDITNHLLKTFRRRVPLKVSLSSISKRPLVERCKLIENFFKKEAIKIDRDIEVPTDVVDYLLKSELIGNVGSLENQVKLLCAENFNRADNSSILKITSSKNEKENNRSWLIKSSQYINLTFSSSDEINVKLASFVKTLLKNEKINRRIENQSLAMNQFLRDLHENLSVLIVDEDYKNYLYKKLTATLKPVFLRYGLLKDLKKVKIEQAASLLSVLHRENNKTDLKELRELVEQHYPRTTYICNQVKNALDIKIDANWLIIVLLYVICDEIAPEIEKQKLLGIMVCHGGAVASNICSIVNSLCGSYIFEAFDMPIDVSNREIVSQISCYIRKQNRNYDGTILLFDMGSLASLYKNIKALLNNDLLVINNITTAIALDLGLQIQQGTSFKKIAEKAEKYPDSMKIQYYEGISQKSNVIVSCMSGVGLSEEVKKILKVTLKSDIEVITMDYRDLKSTLQRHDHSYFKNTKFILTTNDVPKQNGIEVLNLYDVMDEDGDLKLRQLLKQMGEDKKTIDNLIKELLKFFTIGGIKGRLRFLNPEVVIPEIQEIVAKFEKFYHLNFSNKLKLSLYMHIALMLERLMLGGVDTSDVHEKVITKDERDFNVIAKKIFRDIEEKYNITVNDYELSLIYELLKVNFNK